MRLLYAGTPAVAVPALDALARSSHEVVAVLTRPDAPLGRKRVLTPSPVAARAAELGIPVIKAARADDELTTTIAGLEVDLGVVVAYGALLREPLLSTPRLGWINLHFSLLPRWRGAAPVQHALLAGDERTGASVFQLEAGMDTGPVYATLERSIQSRDTAGTLLAELAETGAALLSQVVDDLAGGRAGAVPQRGDVTLAPKLTLSDGAIDPTRTADDVLNRFRGTTPEPGAHLTVGGSRLKLLDIRAAAGELAPGRIERRDGRILLGTATAPVELVTVHPAGKRAMAAPDWWRGLGVDSLVAETAE